MLSVKWPVFGAQSQLCLWHSRVGAILRRPQCLWQVHHTPLYSSFHRAEEWLHYSPINTYTFTKIHPLLTWSRWNPPLSEIPPICEGGNKTEQNWITEKLESRLKIGHFKNISLSLFIYLKYFTLWEAFIMHAAINQPWNYSMILYRLFFVSFGEDCVKLQN